MIAGENLYAGDWVSINQRDGLVYQATWEEFKAGSAWSIPTDILKGEALPTDILISVNSKKPVL